VSSGAEGREEPASGQHPYGTPFRRAPDNPWWIPPFLGRVPGLPPSQIQMLGVIALAVLFENYDQAMLTAALKQIGETFAVAESDLGALLGRVHLGAVAAFLLLPFADRVGRRRLFLGSLVGLSLATFLTAFARTADQLVALQMLSRTFTVTCSATSIVIVIEELPARQRGWGIGIVGALGAFGYGLGLVLFAAIDVLPYGWRSMYLVGIVPLLFLPRLGRRVPETQRFEQHRLERGAGHGLGGWLRPLASLVRAYPARSLGIGAIGLLVSAGQTTGFSFAAFHAQAVHGWSPGQYSIMAIAAGTVGIVGHPWAGRVADRRGRRSVGFALFAVFPLLALAFYLGPGWLLPFVWVPLVFSLTGTSTIERAVGSELFPTSYRGTASGWLQLSEAVGRSAGLSLVAWGTPAGGSNVPMICLVVFASLLAALVLLLLPETGSRELEEVSAERAPAGPAAHARGVHKAPPP
jgi:MFS family permease